LVSVDNCIAVLSIHLGHGNNFINTQLKAEHNKYKIDLCMSVYKITVIKHTQY